MRATVERKPCQYSLWRGYGSDDQVQEWCACRQAERAFRLWLTKTIFQWMLLLTNRRAAARLHSNRTSHGYTYASYSPNGDGEPFLKMFDGKKPVINWCDR